MTDIYWIYDLPNWQLALGIISIYLMVAVTGLLLCRRWFYRRFTPSFESNEMTNGIFSGVGMLYGLLVGLVAVAAWGNYDSVDDLVSREASLVTSLYRDVSTLREPSRTVLREELEGYLEAVIQDEWPAHQSGLKLADGARVLTRFHQALASYQPLNAGDQSLYQEALAAFNRLSEARRLRIGAVSSGIPEVFWVVIIVGGLLTLPLIYLFYTPNVMTHLLVTSLYGTFMGFMMFLLAAIDNPLRGEVSISAEPYQSVLDSLTSLDPDGAQPPP